MHSRISLFSFGRIFLAIFILSASSWALSSSAQSSSSIYPVAKTVLLKEFGQGQVSGFDSYSGKIISHGSKSFIVAKGSGTVTELWASNGTPTGFEKILDTLALSSSSFVPVVFQGKLFFAAGGYSGHTLWSSDGTKAGTQKVYSLNYEYGQISDLTPSGNQLFFAMRDTNVGSELGVYNGSTTQIIDIWPGRDSYNSALSSGPSELRAIGTNEIVFKATKDTNTNYELWKSDGTPGGTVLLHEFNQGLGSGGSPSKAYSISGGKYAIFATNPTGIRSIWRTDFVNFDSIGILPQTMSEWNAFEFDGRVVLPGDPSGAGNSEWWGFDGNSFSLFVETDGNSSVSSNQTLVAKNSNQLFFWSTDVDMRVKLFVKEGSSAPTKVADFDPTGDGKPMDWYTEKGVIDAQGHLWLRAFNGQRVQVYEVWRENGNWIYQNRSFADSVRKISGVFGMIGTRPVFACTDSTTYDTELCGVNRAPQLLQPPSINIAANSPVGTFLGVLGSSDLDGDPVQFKLLDTLKYKLKGDSLFLKLKSLDNPGVISLQVELQDAWLMLNQQSLQYEVKPNSAPYFIVKQDTLGVSEGSPQSYFPQRYSSPNTGSTIEAWQKLKFNLRPMDPNEWNDFGGYDSLFVVKPMIDSTNGDLKFQLKPNAYTPANRLIRYLYSLRDDGGVLGGGVDSTQWYPLEIGVIARNSPPLLKANLPDTLKSLNQGVLESLVSWMPAIGKGDAFEEQDTTQKISLIEVKMQDTSAFIQRPVYDRSTNVLSFKFKPSAKGVYPAKLVIRDNGGTANGGSDSLIKPLFFAAPGIPNKAPYFSTTSNDIVVVEGDGKHVIPNWATSIDAGDVWENQQVLRFVVRPQDSLAMALMGGPAALFKEMPHIDSLTGNLSFEFHPNVYTQSGRSFDMWVKLYDNGGVLDGGVDSSTAIPLRISVKAVNDAPHLLSALSDTIRSQKPGQPEILVGWLPKIFVGDSLEVKDTTQKIVKIYFKDFDSSRYTSYPSYDMVQKTLNFTVKGGVQGSSPLTLVIKDNGGVADGGVDSLTIPLQMYSPFTPNQAPSFHLPNPNYVMYEGQGPQNIPGFAQNISAGAGWESQQILHFQIRPKDSAKLVKLGGFGLFKQKPRVDSLTGNLLFELHDNAYGFEGASYDFQLILRDDGGVVGGGVDSSQILDFSIRANPINDAPRFATVPNDTVLGLNVGQVEIIQNWLPQILVGDSIEQNDTTQRIQNVVVFGFDTSIFSQIPQYDDVQNRLTFAIKAGKTGTFPLWLRIRDNAGVQNGGIDSLVRAFVLKIPSSPNQAPTFTASSSVVSAIEDNGVVRVTNWAQNINPGAPAEQNQKLTFNVVPANLGSMQIYGGIAGVFKQAPQIDAITGDLTFELGSNIYSNGDLSLDLLVRLRDDGGIANGGVDSSNVFVLKIQADAVNEGPVLSSQIADTVRSVNPGAFEKLQNWLPQVLVGDAIEQRDTAQRIVSVSFRGFNSALFDQIPVYDLTKNELSFAVKSQTSGTIPLEMVIRDNGGIARNGVDSLVVPLTMNVVAQPNRAPTFTLTQTQINVSEDIGEQRIIQWAQNISPGSSVESWQQLNFRIRPQDSVALMLLGGPSALFKTMPKVDPLKGDLVFEFNPDVYTFQGRSFDLLITLHDNGGLINGGVDSSVAQPFSIVVQGVNDGPRLLSAQVDTIRSINPGQQENLTNWLPNFAVGDSFESKDPMQGGLSYEIRDYDPNIFIQSPVINVSQKSISFQTQPWATGTSKFRLVVKDQGGTAFGGTDSNSIMVYFMANGGAVKLANDPPVLPNFSELEVPLVTLQKGWQWTTDTSKTSLNLGNGERKLLHPTTNLFLRNVADTNKLPSKWINVGWRGGFVVDPQVVSSGLAMGYSWGNRDDALLSNVVGEIKVFDAVGAVEQSVISNQVAWSWAFVPTGKHRLLATLKTVDGEVLVSRDTVVNITDSVLKRTLAAGGAGRSSWVMMSMGQKVLPGMEFQHWEPSAPLDPLRARYKTYVEGSLQNPILAGWTLVDQAKSIDYTDNYPKDTVSVGLSADNEGWNQVSNPYPFALGSNSVDGGDQLTCWQWDRLKSDYVVLDGGPGPFEACWVNVTKPMTLKFKPIAQSRKKDSSKSAARLDLRSELLSVGLFAGAFQDSANLFGIAGSAQSLAEIPSPSDGRVVLAFEDGGRLMQKSISADPNKKWNLVMQSGVSGLANGELRFAGLDGIRASGQNLYFRPDGGVWQKVESVLPVKLGRQIQKAELMLSKDEIIAGLKRFEFDVFGQHLSMDLSVDVKPVALQLYDVNGKMSAYVLGDDALSSSNNSFSGAFIVRLLAENQVQVGAKLITLP